MNICFPDWLISVAPFSPSVVAPTWALPRFVLANAEPGKSKKKKTNGILQILTTKAAQVISGQISLNPRDI